MAARTCLNITLYVQYIAACLLVFQMENYTHYIVIYDISLLLQTKIYWYKTQDNICTVHSPTNALFYLKKKTLKFTLKST